MAFVHCHKCSFNQDDFWSWSYNPVRCFFRNVADYIRPHICHFGSETYGDMFSWRVLYHETGRLLRRIRGMEWWTWKSFKRERERLGRWPSCPECGTNGLCID